MRAKPADPKPEELTPAERHQRTMDYYKLIAVPLTVALGTWIFSSYLAHNTVDQAYVSLCIQILGKETSANDPSSSLRPWAVTLLNRSAPVRLPEEAQKALSGGLAFLPTPTGERLAGPSGSSLQAAFAEDTAEKSFDTVKLLNSALAVLEGRQMDPAFSARLRQELVERRDSILRQQFGGNTYSLFLRSQTQPESLSEEDREEIKPIQSWHNALLQIK